MTDDNLRNLLRDVVGRLERLEESRSTPSTRRAQSNTAIASLPGTRNRQDTEMPGPSCSISTLNRGRFFPYNFTSTERNRVFRPSSHRQNSHPKSKKVEKWRHEFVCLETKGKVEPHFQWKRWNWSMQTLDHCIWSLL